MLIVGHPKGPGLPSAVQPLCTTLAGPWRMAALGLQEAEVGGSPEEQVSPRLMGKCGLSFCSAGRMCAGLWAMGFISCSPDGREVGAWGPGSGGPRAQAACSGAPSLTRGHQGHPWS